MVIPEILYCRQVTPYTPSHYFSQITANLDPQESWGRQMALYDRGEVAKQKKQLQIKARAATNGRWGALLWVLFAVSAYEAGGRSVDGASVRSGERRVCG